MAHWAFGIPIMHCYIIKNTTSKQGTIFVFCGNEYDFFPALSNNYIQEGYTVKVFEGMFMYVGHRLLFKVVPATMKCSPIDFVGKSMGLT